MSKNGFLTYVHSFRGFAILNIVAIHSFAFAQLIPADWNLDRTSLFYILNETLFHDSTIYFALISGLLFFIPTSYGTWLLPTFFVRWSFLCKAGILKVPASFGAPTALTLTCPRSGPICSGGKHNLRIGIYPSCY